MPPSAPTRCMPMAGPMAHDTSEPITPTMTSTPIGLMAHSMSRSSKKTVRACITPPLRLMSFFGTTTAMARLPRIERVATTTPATPTAAG